MHAVVVRVSIADFDGSVEELRTRVVPGVSQAPGFVAGYWTRKDDTWFVDDRVGVRRCGKSSERAPHAEHAAGSRASRRRGPGS